jgi:hypothetical protein
MIKRLKKAKLIIPLLVLLAVLPAVWGIVGPGFYSLHDDMHVAWLYEMDRAVRSGQLPPRWVPDLSFNYGYPLFNFVYPLPFYLGEIFYLLGISLVGSIKMVYVLSLVFSGLTMFFFLRRNFGSLFSFLGSILYVYTPYRAVDVYVRGAIGEALAFVFLPLVGWAIDRLVKEGGRKNIALTGIAFGLLILSHNIAFLMTIPFLLFYGAMLISSLKKRKQAVLNLVSGFLLGVGISSFFWLPAFWEKRYMVADTVFNYWDHFPFIKQLILPSWGYGISIWGPNDEMSFQIGVVNLLVMMIVVLGFAWLLIKKKSKKQDLIFFIWGLASLGVVLFLMNIRSSFIWRSISLLPYFQFPWRFLILTTFLTAFLAATVEKIPLKPKKWLAACLLVLVPFLTFNYFKPEKVMSERTDDYFMNRYFANKTKTGYTKETSLVYLTLKEEYLRLPLWTNQRPEESPQAKIETEKGELVFQEKSAIKFLADLKTPEKTKVNFHNYYYPGWQALVDGKKIEIEINEPYGDMLIRVPEGEHQILFRFIEAPLRIFANLLSLISIIIALGLFTWKKWLKIF